MRRLQCTAGLCKFQLSWLTDNKNKVYTFIRNLTLNENGVFVRMKSKLLYMGREES